MLPDDRPGDGQAETCPLGFHLTGVRCPEEPVEDPIDVGRGDPESGVQHLNRDRRVADVRRHLNVATIRAELDRVLEQTEEHGRQLAGRSGHRCTRRTFGVDGDRANELAVPCGPALLQDASEIDRLGLPDGRLSDRSHLEQLVDQLQQPITAPRHHVECKLLIGAHLAQFPGAEHLEIAENPCQWRAKLVRHRGNEGVLEQLQVLVLAQITGQEGVVGVVTLVPEETGHRNGDLTTRRIDEGHLTDP